VLRSEFDVCEVYSIDEAFFEIDDGSTEAEIAKVRARIIQRTGIPVSIGIATSKTLAKVANSIAKRNTVQLTKSNMYEGVCILREGEWQEVQKTLPCGSVWGIGRQTSAVLSKHKIYTVADLLEQDRAFIRGLLGVIGERLCVELSGASVYTLGESARGEQQSYTSTRSFGSSIKDKTVLMSALGHHVAQVAEKLRNDGNVASRMTVLVRGSRFGDFALRKGEASVDLMQGTSDTFTLTREASRLLDSLYDPEIPYKKAGIVMNCIAPCDAVTQQLFQGGDIHMKNQVLNRVTDVLNHRFGAGTVRNGVVFGAEKWKSSQKLISKQYTTCWDEIATVKAS
jgi:DNA polymerase V